MKTCTTHNALPDLARRPDRRIGWLAVAGCVLSLLVAGVLGAAVRTGGTGASVTYGVIDDFGSIVVNGVHYDESAANIIIDGIPGQTRAALKLGMVVEIEGQRDYALNTGTASTVVVNRMLLGQVESVDAGTGEITVLAQRVATDAATRYDGVAGPAQLAAGDWIAVHGLDDPGRKTLVATLVEQMDGSTTNTSTIRGTVSNAHAGRFRIGALDVVTAGTSPDNGDYVTVTGRYDPATRKLTAGQVAATREVEVIEGDETELQGYVADFRGIGDFTVAGVTVNAAQASFSGGRASDLRPNARVSVEGIVRNGILYAEEVEFPTAGTGAADKPAASVAIEVEGRISAFAGIQDFVVKGRHIDAAQASIRNKSGRAPGAGLKAHVKGTLDRDGVLRAGLVEFENP